METHASVGSKTAALTVDNMTFMLERMGEDCSPLQYIRELTQNSIEAITKTPDNQGEIVWDCDWNLFDLDQVFKLSIIDNGVGMTGEEMERYINRLSASSGRQAYDGNYGIGGKIAAGTRNPEGLLYLSWKAGQGYMTQFWKDPDTGEYGLRQFERPDGTFGHWSLIDEEYIEKPDLIDQHGTVVILLGKSRDDNTMLAPLGARPQTKWLRRYLNTRYASIPEGITIRVREGWEEPRENTDLNVRRLVTGQMAYLNDHAQDFGQTELDEATVHWWILRDELAINQNSSQLESAGHVAALYQNELYEIRTGRAAHSALQQFGVIYQPRRIVLYLEPAPTKGNVFPNLSRTSLNLNNEPLPWSEYGHQFRECMPDAIRSYLDEAAAQIQNAEHLDSIMSRLKSVEDLWKISRYRPHPAGNVAIDPESKITGGIRRESGRNERKGTAKGRGAGGGAGEVYALFQKANGEPGKDVGSPPPPVPQWLSLSDGSREEGQIEDRAAEYLPDQNILFINEDFRVFEDMRKRWKAKHRDTPGSEAIVTDVVKEWFEQTLVEAVLGALGMKGSPEWSTDQINGLLSPEGLTASVLPRFSVNQNIGRALGSKLGSLNKDVA